MDSNGITSKEFFISVSVVTVDLPFCHFVSIRRRSVSHTQLMHDKSRSMQEFRRRMWLQELLKQVHTADKPAPPVQSKTPSQTFSVKTQLQKPSEATKDLPEKFSADGDGPNLPQETNKVMAFKDQPLKVATKRKKKVRLGRRRDSEKKRRRARSAVTVEPWGDPDPCSETCQDLWFGAALRHCYTLTDTWQTVRGTRAVLVW